MDIETLNKRIEEIENWKKKLESPETIPQEFDRAIRYRFFRNIPNTSTKSAGSENQSVSESGSSSYSVLKAPDGFLVVTINSVDYYLPYYG